MVDKIRDSENSSEVFTSKHQSNKERNNYFNAMREENLSMQEYTINPIAFSVSNNTDNLYYHQAMKAHDARDFQNAIIKEVNGHTVIKQW